VTYKPNTLYACIHIYTRNRPDRPWGPPSLQYNGYRLSFPGVKRPGRGVDHPPSSSARVKERVELYFYSPSGPSWPVLGRTLPFTFTLYTHTHTHTHTKSNPDISSLFVRRSLWRYIEGSGKWKYCMIGNFSSQTIMEAKWWWRYIGVLYTVLQ
jgi:hypothetical protein